MEEEVVLDAEGVVLDVEEGVGLDVESVVLEADEGMAPAVDIDVEGVLLAAGSFALEC